MRNPYLDAYRKMLKRDESDLVQYLAQVNANGANYAGWKELILFAFDRALEDGHPHVARVLLLDIPFYKSYDPKIIEHGLEMMAKRGSKGVPIQRHAVAFAWQAQRAGLHETALSRLAYLFDRYKVPDSYTRNMEIYELSRCDFMKGYFLLPLPANAIFTPREQWDELGKKIENLEKSVTFGGSKLHFFGMHFMTDFLEQEMKFVAYISDRINLVGRDLFSMRENFPQLLETKIAEAQEQFQATVESQSFEQSIYFRDYLSRLKLLRDRTERRV